MSLLTSDRDTESVPRIQRDEVPVEAGRKVFNGGAIALDAAGYAVPAGPDVKHFRGIADQTVDNSAGSAGALTVNLLTPEGAWWDPASPLSDADRGKRVFFADDHTVTETAAHNCYAGRIRCVDAIRGVLVDHRGAYMEFVSPAATTEAATTGA